MSDSIDSMVERLVAMVHAVERLHSERSFTIEGGGYGYSVCAECRQAWPCATQQAIDELRDSP